MFPFKMADTDFTEVKFMKENTEIRMFIQQI